MISENARIFESTNAVIFCQSGRGDSIYEPALHGIRTSSTLGLRGHAYTETELSLGESSWISAQQTSRRMGKLVELITCSPRYWTNPVDNGPLSGCQATQSVLEGGQDLADGVSMPPREVGDDTFGFAGMVRDPIRDVHQRVREAKSCLFGGAAFVMRMITVPFCDAH